MLCWNGGVSGRAVGVNVSMTGMQCVHVCVNPSDFAHRGECTILCVCASVMALRVGVKMGMEYRFMTV